MVWYPLNDQMSMLACAASRLRNLGNYGCRHLLFLISRTRFASDVEVAEFLSVGCVPT